MQDIPSDRLAEGTTIVAVDGLAARQLEVSLARQRAVEGRAAWTGPTILSYRAWTNSLWTDRLSNDDRQLLGPNQVRRLWQRIIEGSAVSERLIGARNVVRWAIDAAQRLRDWAVDPSELRARPDDLDFASFLEWRQAYDRRLAAEGWLDPGDAEIVVQDRAESIATDPGELTVWADFDPTPGQARLGGRLERHGHGLGAWRPAPHDDACQRVRLPEPADEWRAAGRWARSRLAGAPDQRLAIVVPELAGRRHDVHRIVEQVLSPEGADLSGTARPPFVDFGGEPPEGAPLIGSAMTALELFSPRGRFGTFSRWLRSPFFVSAEPEAATRHRLESELRLAVGAQLGFLDALRSGALAGAVRRASPSLAETLVDAVRVIAAEPSRATPTHWVGVWRRLLRRLSWQGETTASRALSLWDSALAELALLTPVSGRISVTEALGELQSILAQPRRAGPTPLAGVFLLPRPEDVGPGYDGIWVTGLTDARWPQPPKPNPILPLALQRAHGMPLASPTLALEYSQRAIQRLVRAAPDVVLSWPAVLHEYPTQPSPLILAFPEAPEEALVSGPDPRASHRLFRVRPRHTIDDPAPALPEPQRSVRGGAQTLNLQATCPLRAFLQGRLQTRPLESVHHGLSARQRGVAAHRAMELLLQELPTRSDLEGWAPAERWERIAESASRALRDVFGQARVPLRVLFDLELERLHALLTELLSLDLTRADFEVNAVEERTAVRVGSLDVNCRIDRMDAVSGADGRPALAIIDYKTGQDAKPTEWLKDRPRDVQLPLYTLAAGEPVEAVAIAILRPEGVQYKGLWASGRLFPGRSPRLPGHRTWAAQLDRWREQLEGLAGEFAAGDTRIFEADPRPARGSFAPLTRVCEQIAVKTGWADHWSVE